MAKIKKFSSFICRQKVSLINGRTIIDEIMTILKVIVKRYTVVAGYNVIKYTYLNKID